MSSCKQDAVGLIFSDHLRMPAGMCFLVTKGSAVTLTEISEGETSKNYQVEA